MMRRYNYGCFEEVTTRDSKVSLAKDRSLSRSRTLAQVGLGGLVGAYGLTMLSVIPLFGVTHHVITAGVIISLSVTSIGLVRHILRSGARRLAGAVASLGGAMCLFGIGSLVLEPNAPAPALVLAIVTMFLYGFGTVADWLMPPLVRRMFRPHTR